MNNKTRWLRQAEGYHSPPELLLYSSEQGTGRKRQAQACFAALIFVKNRAGATFVTSIFHHLGQRTL